MRNLRSRVERVEANKEVELQTVFVGRDPTTAELAELKARGLVTVCLPDNGRDYQEHDHGQP